MNAVWMILVCLAAVLIEIWICRSFSLKKLRYSRTFDRASAVEGEQVVVVEVLRNQKLLPVPWLRIESRISPFLQFGNQENLDVTRDQYHRSVFFLPAFKQITRRHLVTCKRRGFYNLNTATMVSGDLFGLGQAARQLNLNAELSVYPRLLGEAEMDAPTQRWQGDVLMKRWIMPDPYLINGIREYSVGDTMRDIHWKATARTGKLQVKTHDFTAQPKLLIYLNIQPDEKLWSELGEEDKRLAEYGISLAATLAARALSQGMEVGFFCNGAVLGTKNPVRVLPQSGEGQFTVLMEAMARLALLRTLSFPSMLAEDADGGLTGMDILVLSPYWSEAVELAAQNLRRRGNALAYLPLSREEVPQSA